MRPFSDAASCSAELYRRGLQIRGMTFALGATQEEKRAGAIEFVGAFLRGEYTEMQFDPLRPGEDVLVPVRAEGWDD